MGTYQVVCKILKSLPEISRTGHAACKTQIYDAAITIFCDDIGTQIQKEKINWLLKNGIA